MYLNPVSHRGSLALQGGTVRSPSIRSKKWGCQSTLPDLQPARAGSQGLSLDTCTGSGCGLVFSRTLVMWHHESK